MADTPTLAIPLIAENQAGKYLTHNQAIRDIEAILAGGVKSQGDNTPPGSPVDGDAYIIGTAATGDWAGQDENITYWDGSAWQFLTPREGLTLWVDDVDEYFRFETGSPGGWVSTGIAGAGSDALLASNNLSDVGSASTSRTNLGLDGALLDTNASAGTTTDFPVETGTWTPVLEGSTTAGSHTYTTNAGYYERHGNLVYIYANINIDVFDTGAAGNAQITGLPIAPLATNVESIPVGFANALDSAAIPANFCGHVLTPNTASRLDARYRDIADGGSPVISVGIFQDSSIYRFSGWYRVA